MASQMFNITTIATIERIKTIVITIDSKIQIRRCLITVIGSIVRMLFTQDNKHHRKKFIQIYFNLPDYFMIFCWE